MNMNQHVSVISETLLRIADSLEQLVEIKNKPRQARSSAPSEYDPRFIKAWEIYPKRNGSNSKAGAYKAWRARIAQSSDKNAEVMIMFEGVERYAAWCDATEKTNTEIVMQAQRFFGPRREYEGAFEVVVQKQLIRVPVETNELVKFAREHGIEAHIGESTFDFRHRVENTIAQSTL